MNADEREELGDSIFIESNVGASHAAIKVNKQYKTYKSESERWGNTRCYNL
jgi:hypothetical protein